MQDLDMDLERLVSLSVHANGLKRSLSMYSMRNSSYIQFDPIWVVSQVLFLEIRQSKIM